MSDKTIRSSDHCLTMAKGKRLTVRLDEDLEAIIDQACIDESCSKTTAVLSALRRGFAIDDSAIEQPTARMPVSVASHVELQGKRIPVGRIVMSDAETRKEAYDVYNETTGCYSRYRGNGEMMFHFMPTEMVNGKQYYRDTMGDNPNRKWYRGTGGDWIQTIPL